VSSLLKDSRRPCYAVVFDATDADVSYWRARDVNLLRVTGEDYMAKMVALWSFLDLLQMSVCDQRTKNLGGSLKGVWSR
jgi:hypothetical protein